MMLMMMMLMMVLNAIMEHNGDLAAQHKHPCIIISVNINKLGTCRKIKWLERNKKS